MMNRMGERIVTMRKQAEFTQKQVSEVLKMKENAYRHYEKDTASPSIKKFLQLVDLFQTSAEYLISGQKNEKQYKVGEWKPFPQQLQKLRLAANMKQEEVAEQLGIYRESYARYELGVFEPKMQHLYQLKELFGVSMDELLGRIEEEKNQ